ncbi:hypothetical protein MTR67_007050 [Solanum verrucosum]|uniref:Reverse transcriptase zinc-binding domain-containing protein n=1 Tax=Solanum verrucosum TaxID=315347 RepID=A0AAF0Q2K6_SOLVR|nr:hypothetical protein MTR67_007050 [Solanum verrucosum]
MWRLHQKLKRVTATLSTWSKHAYGNIFTKVKEFEEKIRNSEAALMTNNNEDDRQKLHLLNANYIKYLKMEESVLKQKTQLQWFKDGDANTKYFHALVRGRRRRLFLHKICTENDVWIQGEKQLAQAACDYYQQMFTGHTERIDERVLQLIPTSVTLEQNELLQALPSIEELRQVVFAMNPNSTAGPDGIGGKFYQAYWSMINEDLLAAVQSFFCGNIMPKFMSHACLVLLPKTEQPTRFSDLRPISLSNFTNKIISKILSMRLATIFPLLLSDNQFGRGALANSTTDISSLNNATIAHFLVNGKWNERKLRLHDPPLLIPSILNTNVQLVQGVKVSAIWKITEAGNFTCKSAWEICKKKKNTTIINSQLWHRHIPFKMSFLLWRAIRHKLPTNETLANFGVEPVKCYCCIQQGWDDIEHIFIQGNFAGHIWKFFTESLGLNFQQISLTNYLLCWSDIAGKNTAYKTIIQTLPIVICWNLWKTRCSAKYGGKTSKVVAYIEKCKQEVRITVVMWKTPTCNRYKLNTDGSAIHNPGKIGGGGILRVDQGNIVYAFAIPLGEGNNNQAEIQAAIFGLNWCIQHVHRNGTEPPEKQLRQSDQAPSTRNSNSYKPQPDASPESSDNSSKLRRNEAILVVISEEELDWARKIISLKQSGMIHVNSSRNNKSPSKDLPTIEKSHSSSGQIGRSTMANLGEIAEKSPQLRPQIRIASDEMNDISTTGESSPDQRVHHTPILTRLDGGITGGVNSGQVTANPVNNGEETLHQTNPREKDNIPEVTKPLIQHETNNGVFAKLQVKVTAQLEDHN